MSTLVLSISPLKNLSVTSSRASRDITTVSLGPREGGTSKEPTQAGTMTGQSDNGQVWAIIGCVLTIINLAGILVFYLYKKRKKKLRKRVDDGTAIREAGSIPSDSHYTVPTNQDPHYHQIIDSSQDSIKTKETIYMDDGGYITAIKPQSGEIHGYMDMLQFSESSYQEITDVDYPVPCSHVLLQGTCSLNEDSHVGEWPNNSDNTAKRIQKKREKYLVNINIPSDSNPTPPVDDARKSYVLSPELMDDDLFESLNDFAKYFTSLSIKRRNQNLTDAERESGGARQACIESGESDVKGDGITYHEIKSQTDNISSEDTELQKEEFSQNNDQSNKNQVDNASIAIDTKTIEKSNKQIDSTPMKQRNSSSEKCQEISDIERQAVVDEYKKQDQSNEEEQDSETLIDDDFKSSTGTSPDTTEIANIGRDLTSEDNKEKDDATSEEKCSTEALARTQRPEDYSASNVKIPQEAAIFQPLKKSVEMLESNGSSESNQSLNRYIRKHGILLPVKSNVGEVVDISCKRDTI